MLFKFLISLLLLLSFSSFCEAQESVVLPAQITFGTLGRDYEMILKSPVTENTSEFGFPEIFIESFPVTIVRLDSERVRVILGRNFHISIAPISDLRSSVDHVFKSVILNVGSRQADLLMSLSLDKYIATDEAAPTQMKEFIEFAENDGMDSAIKKFANFSYSPPIHKVKSISFFVDVNKIGSLDGVPVGHFLLFAKTVTLPTRKYNTEGFNDGRLVQLKSSQTIFEKEDPLLVSYLQTLEKLKARIYYLESRGWLNGLWQPRVETGGLATSDNSPQVITLSPNYSCRAIF